MRGIPSSVTDIRKKVFTEVARLAYDGDYDRMEKLPYVIVPGSEAKYRESIFWSGHRRGAVRLAMACPCARWTSTRCSPRASRRAPSRRSTMTRP